MIELIGILACLVVCISVPIQARKIQSGWMPAKFTGSREAYVASFRKQLSMLTWVGLGFGLLLIALIAIESEPGEWIVKLIGGLLWLTLSGICFVYGRALADVAGSGAV